MCQLVPALDVFKIVCESKQRPIHDITRCVTLQMFVFYYQVQSFVLVLVRQPARTSATPIELGAMRIAGLHLELVRILQR
jgi:hypothetical protein